MVVCKQVIRLVYFALTLFTVKFKKPCMNTRNIDRMLWCSKEKGQLGVRKLFKLQTGMLIWFVVDTELACMYIN